LPGSLLLLILRSLIVGWLARPEDGAFIPFSEVDLERQEGGCRGVRLICRQGTLELSLKKVGLADFLSPATSTFHLEQETQFWDL